jgi:hypothetical protein
MNTKTKASMNENIKEERFFEKHRDTEIHFNSTITFFLNGKWTELEYGHTTMVSFLDWMYISKYQTWILDDHENFIFVTDNLLTALHQILHFNKMSKGKNKQLHICAHKNFITAFADLQEVASLRCDDDDDDDAENDQP